MGDQKNLNFYYCSRSEFCCTIVQQKEIRWSWLIYNVTQYGHLGIEKNKFDLWPFLPQMFYPITDWHWLLVFLNAAFCFTLLLLISHHDLFCFVESQIFLRKIFLIGIRLSIATPGETENEPVPILLLSCARSFFDANKMKKKFC